MCKISCWHNILVTAELWRAKRACGAPWVSKSTHPRKFGNHVTVHRPPARLFAPQGNQRLILTLSSHISIAHQCCDQLTAVKKGIRWPVSPDRIACSGVDPSRSNIFLHIFSNIFLQVSADKCRPIEVEYLFAVIRWQVTSFQMIAGSSLFFLIHMKSVVFCMCRTIKMLISNWPRKLKFSQFLQAGKTCQLLLTFLSKVTRWSRSTSNVYSLIGQNLTGELMRKIGHLH